MFAVETSRREVSTIRCIGLALVLILLVYNPAAGRTSTDSVRVWVLATSPPEKVTIRSSSEVLHINLRGPSRKSITIEGEHSVTVTADGGGITIVGPGTRSAVRAAGFNTAGGGHLTVATSNVTRRYHGRLTVEPVPEGSGLRLINHVAMDDYVASVVPSEYPFDALEGAKAQAVIARTYALHARESNTNAYDVTDNTASQAYRGIDQETQVSRQAVRATRGQILTYNDRPIEAVYSASGGGHTADNEDVWNTDPVPYLRGKRDPYDQNSPHQKWRFAISKAVLHEILSREYGFTVRTLQFNDRTESGRHRLVTLRGSEERDITASSLRYIVSREFGARSLKSTLFRVNETDEQYVFEGRGFGHGVGLSQWGAHARAEDGQSYDEILQFYYTSVALETVAGEQIAAAQPARTETPEATEERATAEASSRTRSTARSRLHGGWASRKPLSIEAVEQRPPRPGW